MTVTPAPGNEPRPADGPLAPTAPGTPHLTPLTRTQKILTGVVVGAVLVIATLGFIGSYSAVTKLATTKGFGQFAHAFPIAVDAGIIAFLALDLLLTWRRIAFPLLRYTAWGLTAATIAFNAVVSWPDPVGTGMHGVIPILFVIAVEAARHAVGRIAEIVADKHLEGPNFSRWLLNPVGTFVLWRRQRLWNIRTWDQVLHLERERRIYIGGLRKEHGRLWRRKASAEQLLVLWLATKNGMSISEAVALPAREEEKRREEEDRIARQAQEAADARQREADAYQREQQRLEDERARQADAHAREQERQALELEKQRAEEARQQRIADAEAQARLDEIARRQQQAALEDERRRQQEQLAHARAVAAEQERAAEAARRARENEEAAARAAREKEASSRRAAEIVQRASASASANAASASPTPASRTASASRTVASGPAANATAGSASDASANGASDTAASPQAANASASQAAATSTGGTASAVDIQQVVDVYKLLEQQEDKAPSDADLGKALGVSRSRAQQLRTAAVDAGHTELAKPMRIAS